MEYVPIQQLSTVYYCPRTNDQRRGSVRAETPEAIFAMLGSSMAQLFLGCCLVYRSSSFSSIVLNTGSNRIQDMKNRHFLHGTRRSVSSRQAQQEQDGEPDLFEYFDPLVSPHEYPNGISPDQKEVERSTDNDEASHLEEICAKEKSVVDPLQFSSTQSTLRQSPRRNPFGISIPTVASESSAVKTDASASPSVSTDALPMVDPLTTFDPTLSPHAYAKGVPDIIVGDANAAYVSNDDDAENSIRATKSAQRVVGILLMDHGSRNEASNQRLHELARLYQESLDRETSVSRGPSGSTTKLIVEAAHMEIQPPSIQDGLETLLAQNVDEIVCHPFFLSPGRHVKEDIPQLVEQARQALGASVPIRTTPPVGSVTDIMLEAIHSLVLNTSQMCRE